MSNRDVNEPVKKAALPTMFYYTKTVHHEPYDKISPLRPELSARSKNVIVSGGGTGIGKAIAIEFARAGANSVTILGRREDRLKTALDEITTVATNVQSTFWFKVTDLTKRSEVDESLKSISAKVGKIDILVSNAAAMPAWGPLIGSDAEELSRGFENNVISALNIVQSFLTVSAAKPVIINISTGIAHMSPVPNLSGYAITKAANLKMMDHFAAENPNIHLVNVQPGGVKSEMNKTNHVDAPELPGQFCVWLASPEAEFLKSKFVWVNWDVDELIAQAEEIKNSRKFTWLLDGVPM